MRFTLNTNELTSALSVTTHALSPRTTMPILEGVLLEAGEEGLRVTCSDGAMTISSVVPAVIEEEGRIVMPGRLFVDVVRKLPDAELLFSASQNMIATLKCAGSRTTIAGKPADLFPSLPEISGENKVELPQPLLRDMIQQTSFAVSADESRKILTGCLLEIAEGEVRMVALDGFRLAVRIAPISPDLQKMSAVIPSKLLQELSKIVSGGEEDMVTMTFANSQLMAEIGSTTVYATLLEGEYIKYRQIIPTAWKTAVKILDRGQLALCVERASLMAKESKTNLITLTISESLMTITSNSEMGDVYEEIQVETEGEELKIAFNVKYVTDVIRAIEDDEFILHFNSGISPCVIVPVEGNEYTYMVLPVRLNA